MAGAASILERAAPSALVLQPLAMAVAFGFSFMGAANNFSSFVMLPGALALSCLFWVPVRRVAEALAVMGAFNWAFVGYFQTNPSWVVTTPAVLLPWLFLAVEVSPIVRIEMVVLQYLALVPFMESTVGSASGATNLALAIGSLHMLAVWVTLPRQGAWRPAILGTSLLFTAGLAAADVSAYVQSGTNLAGRTLLLVLAVAFAGVLVLCLA